MPEDETAATNIHLTEAERSLIEKRLHARLAAVQSIDRQATGAGGTAPLSDAQERLWILHKLEPESPVAHRPLAFRLHGVLDEDVLARCLTEISRRHAILRTVYEEQGGQPRQRALKPEPVELRTMDLTHLPVAERLSEAHRLAARVARRPFDLEAGPMHPPHLLRLGAEDHVLVLALHHIAFDGWSAKIFQDELSMLYAAFERGARAALPALPMQYAGYARWQRRRQRAESDAVVYWKRQLGGLPAELALPTDRRRPQHRLIEGARQSFQLSAETTRALKALSLEEDATLFMTLLAGFQVLLGRYAHQQDLAVGVPVAGRTLTHTESLIGCFINTLVLRADLSSNPTFRAMVVETRRCVLEALSHQSLSFARVVEMMKPERHVGRAPLVQVLFQLRNLPGRADVEAGSLRIVPFDFDTGLVGGFDVSVDLTETADGLAGTVRYSTDLFDADTVERLAGHYRVLLEGIAADPNRPLSALPLLTEPERHQLLVEWNETAEDFDDVCLHTLFEQQVDMQPDAVALVFEGQEMSFGTLEARANQLAHHLIAQGVGPERRVALYLNRTPETVVALLGVLKAGGAFVSLDPTTPAKRLRFMLEDIEATVLITNSSVADGLPEHSIPTILLDGDSGRIKARPTTRPASSVVPENLAYVLYTSGSTGRPKGVMIEHRAIGNRMQWQQQIYPRADADIGLMRTPLAFDQSIVELFASLQTGARLVVPLPAQDKDPAYLTSLIKQHGVTVLHVVPTMLNMFMETPAFAQCRSLERIFCGGEVLSADLKQRVQEMLAVELINWYGPTETTINATHGVCTREPGSGAVPIGVPPPNVQLYVVDEHLNPVPIGVPGELLIGGVQLARGYLNRPELTAERFIPDPFSNRPGARLYRTGDLVRWLPEGLLDFIGRLDTQVKLRGYRIELGEIEAVLGAHPAVQTCAVTVWEAQPGDQRLVAYLVSDTDSQPERGDLQAYLRQHLMDYMVPSAFVWLPEMPLSASGKINRRSLPAPTLSTSQRDFAAPRTKLEKQIADIWADVLGLEHVSIHDDFFDLGGHSLLAIRIIGKMIAALNVEVALHSIFTDSTVARLAASITEQQLVRLQPRRNTDPGVLSSSQQRFWLLHQMHPEGNRFTSTKRIRIRGPLDVSALQKAFHHIFQRHEVLRSVIRLQEDKLVQVVQPISDVSTEIPLIDLSGLSEQARSEEIERHRHLARNTTFDLGQDPLLRARLLRLGAEEHMLLLVRHHIISDAWTRQILFRELQTGYAAFSKGEVPALPALPIQYADYAAWEQERLQTPPLQRQLEYWKEHLAGVESLALPTDRPRPPVQTYQGAWQTLSLTSTQRAQLEALAQQERVTLFVLLLAVFKVLLSRHAGQQDLVVGTPVAGRLYEETQDLIGCFLNSLALRTDLSGATTFRGALHRVRDTVLGGLSNQEVPFEVVVDAVQPARDLSRAPLFQVFFNMHTFGDEGLHLPGLDVEMLPPDRIDALFDITLFVSDREETLDLRLIYNTDLFDRETIARMIGHYRVLLEAITADPDRRLSKLPVLTEPEKRRLLVEWNDTEVRIPDVVCLHHLIEAQVERCPEAIALVFGEQEMSYGALEASANQLAHYLQERGVSPECRVAIYLKRSPEVVVAMLAVLKAGGAYVPLDPDAPSERLRFMLDDVAAILLITTTNLANELPGHSTPKLLLDAEADSIRERSTAQPASAVAHENLAYVIYTSGSTGRPKGVMIEHQAVVNHAIWMQRHYPHDPDDVVLLHLSFTFDVSVSELFGGLLGGARLILAAPGDEKNLDALVDLMLRHRVTRLRAVPSLLQMLLLHDRFSGCHTLKIIIATGEVVPVALAQDMLDTFDAMFVNGYGPTEAAIEVTFWRCRQDDAWLTIPIGAPIANTQVYVVGEHLNPVPIGVPGELLIGGVQLARGYLNRPELTADRFIPDPFSTQPGARLYRTGDLVRWLPEGLLDFIGRIDNQIKLRGYRIELGEIEAVLGAHPAVRLCAVTVWEAQPGDQRLVAYVVPVAGVRPGTAVLQGYLRERLMAYMVPAHFVLLTEMPLTASGKINRRVLPVPEDAVDQKDFVAPRTPHEKQIAEVWQEVLGLERVGVHDDFFGLGGHSLLAIQAVARLRQHLGSLDIPLSLLFTVSTLAAFATEIDQLRTAALGEDEMVQLLSDLEALSDEEAQKLLDDSYREDI